MLTHMCDIIMPGLPTMLVGHIVPELSIASLFGIRVLTEAGCTVKFDIEKCVVKYNGKIILTGMKDLTTDLWTFPIVGSAGKTTPTNTPNAMVALSTSTTLYLFCVTCVYRATDPLLIENPA